MKRRTHITKKSEKEWSNLYKAYLRQHSVLSEKLDGAVEDTMTFATFKGLHESMTKAGIEKNITRTIVQKEALVSSKQAKVRADAIKNWVDELQSSGRELTEYEENIIFLYKQGYFRASRIRRNPDIMKMAEVREGEVDEDETSWYEHINSPE